MRLSKLFFAVLCAAVALPLCGAPLKVVSVSPKGDNARTGLAAVSVTFNQPVAALSEKSAFAAEDCPLHMTPAVPGKCRFSGTQTLQFEPEKPWQNATQYSVTLPGTFQSRVSGQTLGADYSWTFTTPRPYVQSVTPAHNEQFIDVRPLIYITLSQPVDLASVPGAVSLSYQGEKPLRWWEEWMNRWNNKKPALQTLSVPFSVRALTDEEFKNNFSWLKKDQVFVLQPETALPADKKITLSVTEALRAQEGALGPEKPFTSDFYTYPKLQITGGNYDGCLPFDAHMDFSSPVRLDELLKHVQVSPASALREVTEQERQTLGSQRYEKAPASGDETETPALRRSYFAMPLSFLRLDPKQTVTVLVDKDLQDIYGQRLGQTQIVTITNSGYCPATVFKGGTGVLESYLPLRHPIDVLNTAQLDVQAARYSKDDFIPFFTKNVPYCQAAELAQANLQYKGKYRFADPNDKTQKTYLDLKKFNPTGQNSIIYSQVRVPSKHRTDGYCWVGATDNITDLGVTLKTSQENTLVWVTSLQDAAPQANLNVELKDDANRTLWTGSTDENGLVRAPGMRQLAPQAKNRWGQPTLYVFVTSPGGDAVLASSWNDGLEPWRFNVPYEYSPEQTPVKTALFTERGVYRPGETVYLKGLTRQMQNGRWALPAAQKGTLKIYNARGEEALKKTVRYRAQGGSFDYAFTLPKDAVTGSWQVYFAPEKDSGDAYISFQVEAVKQADFSVTLRALQDLYTGGEKAQFTAAAAYLFGAPVADGKVKWTVRRTFSSFTPKGYEEYDFIPSFLERDFNDHLLGEAGGQLNAQGKLDFSVALPQLTTPQEVYAEAGVQAPTGQQLFARTRVTLLPASVLLGVKMDSYNTEVNRPLVAQLVAVTPQGEPAGPVKVQVKIQKQEYFSVRKNGLAGRLEWVSEKRVKDFPGQSLSVGEKGAQFSFTPPEAGSYQVLLSAKDAQGRPVQGGFTFVALGKGEATWKQNDDDILLLEQDKKEYAPGDTARILVKSPYETAQALVSIEREGVLDAWTTSVAAGADYIEVPVKKEYLPNVFVSVTLVRGRSARPAYDKEGLDLAKPQGKTGYANLKVSQKDRQIDTQILPAKTAYRPGQEVRVKLQTSVQGQGVPAEVTFMAVDEGVLSLTGYKTPDLLDLFYGPARLAVSTADNRVFLIGQRNFGEKGENRGGGGGAEAKLGGVDLRSHFQFTPYYNAQVRTDEKGRGEVKFKLPDNMTTFRLMAVAATVREFGSSAAQVRVSKPLMITPKLPRLARVGDRFACGAVVFNYEDEKGLITLSARADGAVRLNGGEQKLQIAKGAAQEVSWPCEAVAEGPATVAFTARGAQESDGVQTQFTVSTVEKKQTLALYSATQDRQEQLLQKPASVNEKAGSEVSLSLASTALLNLRGGMLYLLSYPYDCLEQKMSKILPVVEGAQLVEDFHLGDPAQYKQKAQEILKEIPHYQTAAGGLAYWPGALPDPYVTAYTLETAYRAQRAGYSVPTAQLTRAATWLKGVFGKNLQTAYPYSVAEDKTARAYAVYVLSLYGQKLDAAFNNLYDQRNSLSVPAQAYLLLAAKALGKDRAVTDTLTQQLLNHAVYAGQTLHFSAGENQPWLHMSEVKVTALCLETLLQTGNALAQPYQAVKWLTDQLTAQGHWNNTHSNAAVFGALNAYYRTQEAAEPDFKAQVALNGQNKYEALFRGRSVAARQTAWPFAQVYPAGDEVRVNVSKKGPGTLYYTLAQTYAPQQYTDEVNAGYRVSRRIADLQGQPVTSFKAGQRYKVTLQVQNSAPASFVVLEDFIPAGFEIVNTSLATESVAQADLVQNSGWGGFTRDEKYDDRIAAFADYLSAGTHEYSYLVQASVSGTFAYPSLWASQMYDPAVFGRNATTHITIEP